MGARIPDGPWAERERLARQKWKANPLWYRGMVFTLRWTVGLVFAVVVVGVLLAGLTSWNPVGGG